MHERTLRARMSNPRVIASRAPGSYCQPVPQYHKPRSRLESPCPSHSRKPVPSTRPGGGCRPRVASWCEDPESRSGPLTTGTSGQTFQRLVVEYRRRAEDRAIGMMARTWIRPSREVIQLIEKGLDEPSSCRPPKVLIDKLLAHPEPRSSQVDELRQLDERVTAREKRRETGPGNCYRSRMTKVEDKSSRLEGNDRWPWRIAMRDDEAAQFDWFGDSCPCGKPPGECRVHPRARTFAAAAAGGLAHLAAARGQGIRQDAGRRDAHTHALRMDDDGGAPSRRRGLRRIRPGMPRHVRLGPGGPRSSVPAPFLR